MRVYKFILDNALKRFFQEFQVPADPGGAPVGTMRRVLAFIQLLEQLPDLPAVKRLIGPQGPVAGHHPAAPVQNLFQAR